LRFGAFQRHPRSGPCLKRAVQAHSGAALRISHPLSGFSVDRVPRPYFMPQPFVDYPPSEISPHEDRGPLSRPLAPLQLSTMPQERNASDLITRGFTDSPAFDAVAWLPPELWVPFSRVRRPASWSPWITNIRIALTAGFTCFEALFPPRVRSHWLEQARA